MSNSADKLILALDGMDKCAALQLVEQIPGLRWVKVGLELFVSSGPEVIVDFRKRDVRVFLDLKFHDIPVTMEGACLQAARTGAEMITVHSCAGINALKAAKAAVVQGSGEAGHPIPTLLGVTVLTSWAQNRFAKELFIDQPLDERVQCLARLAADAGLDGCVCSPQEVGSLRKNFPNSFELVTPGIRLKGSDIGDQVRVKSPSEAISEGASRIVVGRPITCASDPEMAFNDFCRELKLVQ